MVSKTGGRILTPTASASSLQPPAVADAPSPPLPQGPGLPAELAQAEELLEQQLELAQALQEGQEGAWEAQALVLKTQKLKEQMRRLRESLGGGT